VSTPVPVLERPRATCYLDHVTRAMLPIAAVLVLGLGVYLFVEVRAEPAPPEPVMGRASRTSAPPARAPQSAPPADEPVAAPPAPRPSAPPQQAAPGAPATQPAAPTLSAPDEPPPVGPKLDAAMAEANRAYDRGDFDEAKAAAGRLLASDPTNVRMLRIMVSASCVDGDTAVAQAHYARLPPGDQAQMKTRCARYGIVFPDKP
jgi:hypothetical protein